MSVFFNDNAQKFHICLTKARFYFYQIYCNIFVKNNIKLQFQKSIAIFKYKKNSLSFGFQTKGSFYSIMTSWFLAFSIYLFCQCRLVFVHHISDGDVHPNQTDNRED